jgi:hypothetical protein
MFSVMMLPATACTSGGGTFTIASATASHDASLSLQQVTPLFLQCLIEHDVTIWDRAQGDTSLKPLAEKAGWYVNGHVVANQTFWLNLDSLEGFYPISPDFKPDQMIADWIDNAALHGTWPKVCTPLP